MREFKTPEIHAIMSALATQARYQRKCAAEFPGKPERDTQRLLILGAEAAERLRAEFASELHRRGATDCELAHPGHECPLEPVHHDCEESGCTPLPARQPECDDASSACVGDHVYGCGHSTIDWELL